MSTYMLHFHGCALQGFDEQSEQSGSKSFSWTLLLNAVHKVLGVRVDNRVHAMLFGKTDCVEQCYELSFLGRVIWIYPTSFTCDSLVC